MLVSSNDVVEEPSHVENADVEGRYVVFVPRQIEEILHDAIEPQRLGLDRLEVPGASTLVQPPSGIRRVST